MALFFRDFKSFEYLPLASFGNFAQFPLILFDVQISDEPNGRGWGMEGLNGRTFGHCHLADGHSFGKLGRRGGG
jgi:hypothetical protein